MNGINNSKGGDAEELDSIPGVSTNDFAAFWSHLQRELVAESSTRNVDDKEARQLFDMMRTFYDEKHANMTPNPDFGNSSVTAESKNIVSQNAPTNITESRPASMNVKDSQGDWARNDNGDPPVQHQQSIPTKNVPNKTMYADDYMEWAKSHSEEVESSGDEASSQKEVSDIEPPTPTNVALQDSTCHPYSGEKRRPILLNSRRISPACQSVASKKLPTNSRVRLGIR